MRMALRQRSMFMYRGLWKLPGQRHLRSHGEHSKGRCISCALAGFPNFLRARFTYSTVVLSLLWKVFCWTSRFHPSFYYHRFC